MIGDSFDGLDLFITETKNDIRHRLQGAARAAFHTATQLTPVDRGYLKNSWTLTIDNPHYRDSERAGPGVMADLRYIRADSNIYLTNGKSYAEYVNDGTPNMPAHNMLEHAVAAAMDELEE